MHSSKYFTGEMTMAKWVGAGDGRVICLETKKIYSCVEAAAVDISIPRIDIRSRCERWIIGSCMGLNFQWLSQYFEENPNSTLPREKKIEFVEVDKPGIRGGYNTRGFLNFHARWWMKLIYKCLTDYMEEIQKTYFEASAIELHEIVTRRARMIDPNFSTSASGISRHIFSHRELYRNLFNMQLGSVYHKPSRKSIAYYRFEIVNGSEDIVNSNGYDEEMYSIGGVNLFRSMPVIEIYSRTLYSSVSRDAKAIG